MKTFFFLFKYSIVIILFTVGLISTMGELVDKGTTLGWLLSFIIIKVMGLFMIYVSYYLYKHFKLTDFTAFIDKI